MVPQWARFHILRIGCPSTILTANQDETRAACTLAPGSPPAKEHREILLARAKDGKCEFCGEPLDGNSQIDHVRTVKEFTDDMTLDIFEAFRQCWDLANLRLVCGRCNNARNRKER